MRRVCSDSIWLPSVTAFASVIERDLMVGGEAQGTLGPEPWSRQIRRGGHLQAVDGAAPLFLPLCPPHSSPQTSVLVGLRAAPHGHRVRPRPAAP